MRVYIITLIFCTNVTTLGCQNIDKMQSCSLGYIQSVCSLEYYIFSFSLVSLLGDLFFTILSLPLMSNAVINMAAF